MKKKVNTTSTSQVSSGQNVDRILLHSLTLNRRQDQEKAKKMNTMDRLTWRMLG